LKNIYKTTLLLLSFILISNFTFSQSNEIKITFIGNCGLHLTDGETHIYTDFPYKSGAHHYMTFDSSELDSIHENSFFIFTHKHSDHYSGKNIRKTLKRKNGKKYGKWNLTELANLGKIIPDFKIEAFKTSHLFSFAHYSYLITWHGKKIFLSGDTEKSETIATVKNMDWAFIPAWLLVDAKDKGIQIDTKMLGIYHIGPRDNIQITGSTVLMLKKQGELIIIPY
jgi:hypothetical protein